MTTSAAALRAPGPPTTSSRADTRRKRLRSAGVKVVTAYFVMNYVIQLVGNVVFTTRIESPYTRYPLTSSAIVFLIVTYALFLAFSVLNVPVVPALRMRGLVSIVRRIGRAYYHHRLPVAIIILVLSATYTAAGLSPYRYSSVGISERGSPLLLVVNVIRVFVIADLLYVIFVARTEEINPLTREYWENILLAMTLVVSADGSATMFLALIALAFGVYPKMVRRVLFIPAGRSSVRRAKVLGTGAALVCMIFFGAWLAGETIKTTAGGHAAGQPLSQTGKSVFERLTGSESYESGILPFFVERTSIYYYSFLYTMDRSWADLNDDVGWVVKLPVRSFLFRIDYLVGPLFGASRPEVTSISQFNYRSLSVNPKNLREGSSPGVIASFNYVFPFPLNLVLCAVFLAWLAKWITTILETGTGERISLIGTLLFLTYISGLFQSPFDGLLVLDNAAIFFGTIFVIYKVRAEQRYRASAQQAFQTNGHRPIAPEVRLSR